MILTELDECKTSTFNPGDLVEKKEGFPKVGITCFSQKLFDRFFNVFDGEEIIGELSTANGKIPIYKINYKGTDIAIYVSRVGAPACCVSYEEITAMGLEKLIMFGTCGVLDKSIEDLAIIIPTAAIRDEGTSYHYLPASDEIEVNTKHRDVFKQILEDAHVSYVETKTWTTDAPFRETRDKVLKRKEQGCLCVEMECASMAAVSQFRDKEFFEFFYAADNLDSDKWEERSLGNEDKLEEKEKLLYLALELATKM